MAGTIEAHNDAKTALEKLIEARRDAIKSLSQFVSPDYVDRLFQLDRAIEIVKREIDQESPVNYIEDNLDELGGTAPEDA